MHRKTQIVAVAMVALQMIGAGAYVRHMMMRDPRSMWAAATEQGQ